VGAGTLRGGEASTTKDLGVVGGKSSSICPDENANRKRWGAGPDEHLSGGPLQKGFFQSLHRPMRTLSTTPYDLGPEVRSAKDRPEA